MRGVIRSMIRGTSRRVASLGQATKTCPGGATRLFFVVRAVRVVGTFGSHTRVSPCPP